MTYLQLINKLVIIGYGITTGTYTKILLPHGNIGYIAIFGVN